MIGRSAEPPNANGVRLVERPVPAPGGTQVVVKVAYSGICGSDLHALDINPSLGSDGATRLGHEVVGSIVAVGSDARRVVQGQPVAVLPRIPCRWCHYCRRGDLAHCEVPVRPQESGWADLVTVDESFIVPIPDGLAPREAVLLEPLACAMRAADMSAMRTGDLVVVVGGGPLGLLLALLARTAGARSVVVSEPAPYRRALAQRLGLTAVEPTSLETAVKERSAGRGAEVVFEAAGAAAAVEAGIAQVARGGSIVIAGVAPPTTRVSLSPRMVFERELRIVGAWGIETTFLRALAVLPGLGAADVVTHEFELADLANAIAVARSRASGKVVLRGSGTSARNGHA